MQCGAAYGERTEERENSRNGYRMRPWDTRVGSVDLAVPKLRHGVYSPEFLLQPRRRAEKALVAVVCQAYVEGRVHPPGRRPGQGHGHRGDLQVRGVPDGHRARRQGGRVPESVPWTPAPIATSGSTRVTQRVREGGRVVNVSAVIATAANAEGQREIVGFDIVTTEDTAAWTAFLRSLVARGLSGVELVISDAHGGIKAAIAAVLAEASWQRCRTHFMANLASRVPKANWPMIATLVRSSLRPARSGDHLGPAGRRGRQAHRGRVRRRRPSICWTPPTTSWPSPPSPTEHWPKIRSNNPQERLNKEIRRRTDVVGIFPNRQAVIRLVGALLAEQTDEWAIARRYVSVESLKAPRADGPAENDPRPAIDGTAD